MLGPVLLALIVANPARAQFTDDFEDGDFTVGPAWGGNASLFTIVDEGGDHVLRSNTTGPVNYYLSTPCTLANDARWEWFADLRFATSNANYVDMYLLSDNADLTVAQNGWFVRMGGTQDRLELFKRVGGTNTSVLVGPDNAVNSSTSNPFKIRVDRTATNAWTLNFDDGVTGSFSSVGPVTDAAVATSGHFGIFIAQSTLSGAVNGHFFDDFVVGNIPVDLTPPTLLSASVVGLTEVDLLFSEALSLSSVNTLTNYAVDNGLTVQNAALQSSSTVRITFSTPIQSNITYTVVVNDVEDLEGNPCLGQTATFSIIVADVPVARDVVINEIMADPTPPVGLPDEEFIEFFNTTTNKTFDLAGWKITDGTTTAVLPSHPLGPGQYVLLCALANLPLFPSVMNRIGVSSLPSLNNDADNLTLTAPDNSVIDAVSYALSWYQDGVKDDGGWSLEQINPFAACSGAGNWIASNSPSGGTPGAANSVLDPTPDTTPPTLSSVQVVSSTELVLIFNEAMDAASLSNGTYIIAPSLSVTSATAVGGTNNRVSVQLGASIVIGTVYTVTVTGVTDCTGNAITIGNARSFALPEPVAAGDLVINEVLYDPVGTGSDFVELYNRSSKTLSLAGLQLANETNGAIANNRVITTDAVLMLPGEHILLTASAIDITTRYPQSHADRFLEMTLPSYNNGNGTVVLLDGTNITLDLFRYDDGLHFALINTTEGYSLERVDPARPTSDNTNWQSAADVAGRATPGFENSQYARAPKPTGEMTIEPAIFSPDNDGHQDLLTIAYRFDQPGFVGTITIFDIAGREARRLMENQLLGSEGAISWDGLLDGGDKGRMGPYIVLLEAFDLDGNVEKFRKTVTLAHRLN